MKYLALTALLTFIPVTQSNGNGPRPVDPPVITAETRVYTQVDAVKKDDNYPPRATSKGINGDVVLICQVAEDGRMAQCIVEKEAPAGYGFGEATARMFLGWAHTTSKAGQWYRFIYHWRLS